MRYKPFGKTCARPTVIVSGSRLVSPDTKPCHYRPPSYTHGSIVETFQGTQLYDTHVSVQYAQAVGRLRGSLVSRTSYCRRLTRPRELMAQPFVFGREIAYQSHRRRDETTATHARTSAMNPTASHVSARPRSAFTAAPRMRATNELVIRVLPYTERYVI